MGRPEAGCHSKYELKYHFVWCPKYRRIVLRDNVGKYIAKVVRGIAERYDFRIVELAVMPDHVHMFISATPEFAPAEIVRIVKSITAREVFKRFPGIKKMLWGGKLWERGYFVMSSGTGTTDEMIEQYIKQQRLPQANDQPNLFG